MQDCPHPSCGGAVSAAGGAGLCRECREPAGACPSCGAWNRPFAQFCRVCGKPYRFEGADLGSLGAGVLDKLPREPAALEIPAEFWIAPVSFGGYLWVLSTDGGLWRVNPARGEVLPLLPLGPGFGRSSFVIRFLSLPGRRNPAPCLVAASPTAVAILNLAEPRAQPLLVPPESGGRFLADLEKDGFAAVAVHQGRVFVLERHGGALAMVSHQVATGAQERRRLEASDAAGPLVIGNHVWAYNTASLLHVSGAGCSALPLAEGVTPFRSLAGGDDFRFPLGSAVWLTAPDGVYLPARAADRSGFLHLSSVHESLQQHFLALDGGFSYSADAGGRLIVAGGEKLVVFEGRNKVDEIPAPSLAPTGAEHINGQFRAWTCQMGAAVAVRFAFGDRPRNAALPPQLRTWLPKGFLIAGGSLVLVVHNQHENNNLGLSVWNLFDV